MTIGTYDFYGNKVSIAFYEDDYTIDDGEESNEEKIRKFNRKRLALLTENNGGKMFFALAQTRGERQALEFFEHLTPEARTSKLTSMFDKYIKWHEDQQRELERVRG